MATEITGELAQAMVSDWLATPVNGYLGSGYGEDIKRSLHTPMSSPQADQHIAKLKADVPVLRMLPSNAVNLYAARDERQHDKLHFFFEIAGRTLPIA